MGNFDRSKYESIWMCTHTGKKFYFSHIHPDMICLEDIAHALSRICRFNGHIKNFYSIGEHSLLTSRMVEDRLKVDALLHDAGEAYMSDMSRPLKMIMNDTSGNMYKQIEMDILHCINKKFDFPELSEDDKMKIKLADNTALYIESHSSFDSAMLVEWNYGKMLNPIPKFKIPSRQRNMNEVKKKFIEKFNQYQTMR